MHMGDEPPPPFERGVPDCEGTVRSVVAIGPEIDRQ
jgi:hypothetical protein